MFSITIPSASVCLDAATWLLFGYIYIMYSAHSVCYGDDGGNRANYYMEAGGQYDVCHNNNLWMCPATMHSAIFRMVVPKSPIYLCVFTSNRRLQSIGLGEWEKETGFVVIDLASYSPDHTTSTWIRLSLVYFIMWNCFRIECITHTFSSTREREMGNEAKWWKAVEQGV